MKASHPFARFAQFRLLCIEYPTLTTHSETSEFVKTPVSAWHHYAPRRWYSIIIADSDTDEIIDEWRQEIDPAHSDRLSLSLLDRYASPQRPNVYVWMRETSAPNPLTHEIALCKFAPAERAS